MTPGSSLLFLPALGGVRLGGVGFGELWGAGWVPEWRLGPRLCQQRLCFSIHPNQMPLLESQVTLINLGRGRARKRIMGTPCLREICLLSAPPPPQPPNSWLEALRIYTSLCQHQLALCPDSLHPVFSGCLAGFLPLLTRADHCQFCMT